MLCTYLARAPRFTIHILVNLVQRPIALMKAFSQFNMVVLPVPQYLEMSLMIKPTSLVQLYQKWVWRWLMQLAVLQIVWQMAFWA